MSLAQMEEVTMRKVLMLLFLASAVMAQKNIDKTLVLRTADEPIRIDGRIDPVWSAADSVADFVQFQPFHNTAPSRKTVAKLLTTEDALYCLIVCYDHIDNIQKHTGKLDDFGGDVVSLMLDTFGNKRTAYKFAVSASGVRGDCRLLDDARNRDYSWDGIWFADSKIYDWGYVVEMKIPYKSIKYDSKSTEWGLDFDRWIPTLREDIYWCTYEEVEGQRISSFGRLIFEDFKPAIKGTHLELYPVGIARATYQGGKKYDLDPAAGIDIFYNPSPSLTLQLTANPDFAQIEADPYRFNISRYETYFSERRPFFTEGNEIFMAAGKQRDTGFYEPLELFYSRRIGRKLPDGSETPILFGTKTFGRINKWEYGGFMAVTGKADYLSGSEKLTEDQAVFTSIRLKRQIMGNSTLGLMYVGKHSNGEDNGVLDIDGAFRGSSWQLAYQLARSYRNQQGDFASSAGLTVFQEKWMLLWRARAIGDDFDIDGVGFVPWKGTAQSVVVAGPRWYFNEGNLKQFLIYTGGLLNYEKVDAFTDYGVLLGFNMQFRSNWGYEVNCDISDSKDEHVRFTSYNLNFNSWFHTSPVWSASFNSGFSRTYNFYRDYLAFYSWAGGQISWKATNILSLGTSVNAFAEGNPDGNIAELTYNARPYASFTPINNLNLRIYLDNVMLRSSSRLERAIFGFLFSYNFKPKSWIYFAINEIQNRSDYYDASGNLLSNRMRVVDRVSVLKLKYLYYF